jgi:hypothetical protein
MCPATSYNLLGVRNDTTPPSDALSGGVGLVVGPDVHDALGSRVCERNY